MSAARRAGKWVVRALAIIGLMVVLVLATPLDRWWAHAYAGSFDQPRGDVLILLSAAADDHGVISYTSYWRARYTLLAWKSGDYRTILICGTSAPSIENFLVAEGVPASAIVLDAASTSTLQNAEDAATLLRGLPGRRVLLTSDFHMFRARRVFERQGISATPYAAPDVYKQSLHWYGRIPAFQTLLVETTKIAYYKLRGWM